MKKWWFNFWYKYFPPSSVHYFKKKEVTLSRVVHAKDGSFQMEIPGEKYNLPNFPRQHVLLGPLAKIKKAIKEKVFNQVFAEIEKMGDEHKHDMLPPERMSPSVRELYRVLDLLENAEVVPDMKGRIRLIKRIITFFLQEDDAYRFRYQWVLERLDISKIKMTEADKYYMRGKYFKTDMYDEKGNLKYEY